MPKTTYTSLEEYLDAKRAYDRAYRENHKEQCQSYIKNFRKKRNENTEYNERVKQYAKTYYELVLKPKNTAKKNINATTNTTE